LKRTRTTLLLTLLAAILAVAATGCGNDDDAIEPTATAQPTPSPNVEDRDALAGGEITVQYREFQSFDPHVSSFTQDFGHQGMVWRGLYDLSESGRPVPRMAASDPHISPDGLTYTVTLRDGLVWSDGEPLTAGDFVAGIQRTCSFAIAGAYRSLLSNIEGCDAYANPDNADLPEAEQEALREAVRVEAVDDVTVRFHLVNPQPTFPLILALWVAWPVPTHIVTHPGDPWPAPMELAFNGPFVVEQYQAGTQMVLARNEHFAGDMALLDRITLRYVDDAETANNAFRTGELDMALANVANLSALQQEFPQELLSTPRAGTIGLMMNLNHPPLDQVEVRQALARAIDRNTLVNVVLQGAHIPTTTWTPSEVLGVEPDAYDDAIGYDPEAAQRLLADAGFPGGEGFPELEIVIVDTSESRTIAEFLQQQFLEILGIPIRVEALDGPSRVQRFVSGDYQLYPGGFQQDYPDPENWLSALFSSTGSLNFFGCSDPEIDELIEQARFNRNESERRNQYRQVNELVVTRVCGIAPYHHLAGHYLVSGEIGGARELAGTNDRVLPGDWSVEDWHLLR
jgi:oligopeptide transport system substrate-binding protein